MHFTIESAFCELKKVVYLIHFLTNPEEDSHHLPGDLAALPADGGGQVPGEEGEPADEEGAHHHPQGHEGLVFLPPRGVDSLSLFQGCKHIYTIADIA